MGGWMGAWMHGCMDAWMHGCMYVCMYICMYVCMYVYSVSGMVWYPLPVDVFLGGGVVVAAVVLPLLARLGYRFGGDSI